MTQITFHSGWLWFGLANTEACQADFYWFENVVRAL